MRSWLLPGNDMSVYVVAANDIRHGSYQEHMRVQVGWHNLQVFFAFPHFGVPTFSTHLSTTFPGSLLWGFVRQPEISQA